MADRNSYYSLKASTGALLGAAAGLSNPNLYLLFLLSLFVAAIVYATLDKSQSKRTFVAGFAGISIYSFLVGRFLFDGTQLTDAGLGGILLALLAGIVLSLVVRALETEASDQPRES